MKRCKLLLGCSVAIGALLSACSGSPSGKTLKEMNPTSSFDSVSYYYGQLMAGRMINMGSQDSTYKTKEGRDAYWEGFNKGFSLLKDADTETGRAYNEGLTFGMQMAANFQQTKQDIPDFNFNKKMFDAGYAYAFRGDSAVGIPDAQYELERTMNALQDKADAAHKQKMEATMSAYAKKHGYKKDLFGYYEKVEKPGKEPQIAVGDSIILTVNFATSKGKDMTQYDMPATPMVLGKTMPMEYPYAKILETMQSESVVKALMLPAELFGQAATSFRLDKDEFIIVTLTAKFVEKTSFKPSPVIKSDPVLR